MPDKSVDNKPVRVFFSYSHEDDKLRDQLVDHLSILTRQEVIESWHDRMISAGTEWKNQINENLDAADIILLLISSHFLSSDYCYDIEMKRAMQRHESGEAQVIPIILRPSEWHDAPFGKLQALPPNGKPVTSWKNRDEAFKAIVQGIKRVISGQELSMPVLPNKRKRLWDWAFKEKHWPLLLSFIIPLYFLVDFGLNERAFLKLGGITLFIIGILYRVIRRQSRLPWPSYSLEIVGAGLILIGLVRPICSPIRPGSDKTAQDPNKRKLIVTIARFKPDVLTSRRYARDLNTNFQDALSEKQDFFIIKTYDAEVEDKDQEKIDAPIKLPDSCKCNVFVSAVVRKSSNKEENEEWADFNLRMGTSEARSDSQKRIGVKPIEPKNIIVKNQKEYDSLVKLLVAYAYYKWGQWDDAIDILRRIIEEKKAFLDEAYFYNGLCRLNKGLQHSDDNTKAEELKGACASFKDAAQLSDKSTSLNVLSQINLVYTQTILSQYLTKDKAVNELNLAIKALDELSQLQKEDKEVKKIIGQCDPTKVMLVPIYAQMQQIDGNSDWLEKAKNMIEDFDSNCSEYKATYKANLAEFLAEVGMRSRNAEEFKGKYEAAISASEKAYEYFEQKLNESKESKDRYLQDWVIVVNDLASNLADLGAYLGSDGRDRLERANERYEEVLRLLSKDEYLDKWAWTKSNQAATLIDLGSLNPVDEKYYKPVAQ
jgi:tetratricopeptide (TPR) repeat protein